MLSGLWSLLIEGIIRIATRGQKRGTMDDLSLHDFDAKPPDMPLHVWEDELDRRDQQALRELRNRYFDW